VKIPWVAYASAGAELLPVVPALARWKRLDSPQKWIAVWSAFLVASEVTTLLMALQGVNNHWVNYVAAPTAAALVLWALSEWHPSVGGRRTIRFLIPITLILWIAMIALFEDTKTFSVVAEPILGLILMVAVLATLVARTMQETGRIRDQSWWWISVGLMLTFGITVAFAPAAYILLQTTPELLMRAFEIKAVLNIVAFLLIARGVLIAPPNG
jgi:hypothetical protein